MSSAIWRAIGEILIACFLFDVDLGKGGGVFVTFDGDGFVILEDLSLLESLVIFSPESPIKPIGSPTGTVDPSFAVILSNVPVIGASNSTIALSVSISAIISPVETLSPSDFIQRTTVPSVIS